MSYLNCGNEKKMKKIEKKSKSLKELIKNIKIN